MSSDLGFHAHPGSAAVIARCANILLLLLLCIWVFAYLGGLGFTPTAHEDGSNDTSTIFNYHPLLMVAAFPVLMGEALLAFRQPPAHTMQRPTRKRAHWTLHTCAITLALAGLVAAYRSHSLKLPTPTPNLYSVHSYLGLTTALAAVAQYIAGFVAYLQPKLALPQRRALMPAHQLLGRSVFVLGLATCAVGLQEKATFVQVFGKAGVYSAVMVLPAVMVLLLVVVGVSVLYVHAVGGSRAMAYQPVVTTEDAELQ